MTSHFNFAQYIRYSGTVVLEKREKNEPLIYTTRKEIAEIMGLEWIDLTYYVETPFLLPIEFNYSQQQLFYAWVRNMKKALRPETKIEVVGNIRKQVAKLIAYRDMFGNVELKKQIENSTFTTHFMRETKDTLLAIKSNGFNSIKLDLWQEAYLQRPNHMRIENIRFSSKSCRFIPYDIWDFENR